MSGTSGNQRVLALLRRGGWISSREIGVTCEVTVNSRVAELRKLGCVIACRHVSGREGRAAYEYRLDYDPLRESAASDARVPALADSLRGRRGDAHGAQGDPGTGRDTPDETRSSVSAPTEASPSQLSLDVAR